MSLFNNPGTEQSSGNMFGNNVGSSGTSTPAAPNIFGGTAAKQPTTSGLFGAPSTSGSGFGGTGGGGLFGGGGATGTTSNLFGGGLGTPAAGGSAPSGQNSSNAAVGAGLLGGATTGKPNFFGQPSTMTPASTTPASVPAGGLFSKPTESATTPNPGSSLAGGGLFGKKPEEQSNSTAAPSTTSNMFGNNLFAKKPETPALGSASTNPSATPAAAPMGGLFANLAKPPEKDPKAPAASGFNLFGAKDSTGEKKDAPTTLPSFSLTPSISKPAGSIVPAPKADSAALTSVANTTSAVAILPPSTLRGKSIEEIVNKWSADLETHVREFNKFASEVAAWDRTLMENGSNLASLYSHVLAAEREQADIDQSLDHIEQQQNELSITLDAYEKSAQEILGGQGGSLRALDTGPADTERDKSYMLATDLHTHMEDLSGSLTQMIESVNSLSVGSEDVSQTSPAEDPMSQIAQILSSHLESLQWIDSAVREVEGKVADVDKRVRESGISMSSSSSKSRGFGLNR